jgi:NTE family protein
MVSSALRFASKVAVVSLICVVIIVLDTPSTALAQDDVSDRPRIGLVLSGGGARGAAHVGVIKVLEELQVPIDYIAGTSMGAIVGGLYASGMSSAELETTMATLDWADAFRDQIEREERSFRRKRDDDLYLVKAQAGFNEGKISLPTGIIAGQKVDLLLRSLTLQVSDVDDFDDLTFPFRAVAADIVTGHAVVLDSGDLAMAMRASMNIPAVFALTEIDGRLLVDGGVANNLPKLTNRCGSADGRRCDHRD